VDFEEIVKSYPDITELVKNYLDDLKVYESFEEGTMEVAKPTEELLQKRKMIDDFKEAIQIRKPR